LLLNKLREFRWVWVYF